MWTKKECKEKVNYREKGPYVTEKRKKETGMDMVPRLDGRKTNRKNRTGFCVRIHEK
jgi:hypothetical protein